MLPKRTGHDAAVTWADAPLLLAAGFAAGIIGTVAGLASLVSYPVLLAVGLPPVAANVTNTVALIGSGLGAAAGSRPELRGAGGTVARLGGVVAAGGAAGAALLLLGPPGSFERVVPFLIGGASVALLLQPRIRSWAARRHGGRRTVPVLLFAVAIYGGYFGAAAGVMMLALLASTRDEPLVRSNALKNVLLGIANAVAAVGFAAYGPVDWPAAGMMAAGVLAGGWTGPAIGRRLPERALRVTVGVAGLGLAVKLLLDAFPA